MNSSKRLSAFFITGFMLMTGAVQAQEIVFPAPDGAYAVGMLERLYTDTNREEIFTEMEGDQREVLVTFYYPRIPDETQPASPYVEESKMAAVVSVTGISAQVYNTINVHHVKDAPVLATVAPYPVILFSHGMGLMPLFYTSMLENLASKGYVVAAIHHPYSAPVTVLPDGRIIKANHAGNFRLTRTTDDPEQLAVIADEIRAVWLADQRFVLDQLAQDEIWDGIVDLENVGVMGHSFGGVTALRLSQEDERVHAAINLDGTLLGEAVNLRARVPSLMWRREALGLSADFIALEEAFLETEPHSLSLILEGSEHNTFTLDFLLYHRKVPFMIPAEMVGTIESNTAYEVITTSIIDFFDAYLRDGVSFEPPQHDLVQQLWP